MLKQELLDYAAELKKKSNEISRLVEGFDAAGFNWENVTETQLAIFKELHPLQNFFELRQDAIMQEGIIE